jgi:hypothetical protein
MSKACVPETCQFLSEKCPWFCPAFVGGFALHFSGVPFCLLLWGDGRSD